MEGIKLKRSQSSISGLLKADPNLPFQPILRTPPYTNPDGYFQPTSITGSCILTLHLQSNNFLIFWNALLSLFLDCLTLSDLTQGPLLCHFSTHLPKNTNYSFPWIRTSMEYISFAMHLRTTKHYQPLHPTFHPFMHPFS